MDVHTVLAEERRALAARLRDLPGDGWDTPSLCHGWTVRHVVAHLLTPLQVSVPAMAVQVARSRGIGGAMDAVARRLAHMSPAELLDALERGAGSRTRPPGLPLSAPLTDVVVHTADACWPLGDDRTYPRDPERLRPVLDFVTGRQAVVGFVPPGRTRGLRLVTTDLDWSRGDGAEVRGPALALAVAVLGRSAALEQLHGPGVAVLAERVPAAA